MTLVSNRLKQGFTLLELLMVVIILGVITAVLVPQIGAGLASTRLAAAARTSIQAARYARTMALLNQAETDLILGLKSGGITVMAAERTGENAVPAGSGLPQTTLAGDPGAAESSGETEEDASRTNRPAAVVTAQNFADELKAEYQCEGVQFRFLGYADSLDAKDLPVMDDEAVEARIRFRSNGTCRPFKLRVLFDEEEWMDVEFDVTGSGKVLEDAN
jgi:prepilin-type N-terminal cleavage/methylation domain-containing protein